MSAVVTGGSVIVTWRARPTAGPIHRAAGGVHLCPILIARRRAAPHTRARLVGQCLPHTCPTRQGPHHCEAEIEKLEPENLPVSLSSSLQRLTRASTPRPRPMPPGLLLAPGLTRLSPEPHLLSLS